MEPEAVAGYPGPHLSWELPGIAVSRGHTVSSVLAYPDVWVGSTSCPCPPGRLTISASSSLSLPGRAWAQEKQELLSSEKQAADVAGAKQLLEQHEEMEQAIQECCLQAQSTRQEGQQLLDSGHFMSLEV